MLALCWRAAGTRLRCLTPPHFPTTTTASTGTATAAAALGARTRCALPLARLAAPRGVGSALAATGARFASSTPPLWPTRAAHNVGSPRAWSFFDSDRYTDFRRRKPFHKRVFTEARYFIPVVLLPVSCAVVYVMCEEEVEFSGRRRPIFVTRAAESLLGEVARQDILDGGDGDVLPADHDLTLVVRRVTKRIATANNIEHAGEVYVVDNRDVNAYVTPGGVVVVYTGLFQVVRNENELAVVLAHEMGHMVARHVAEKLSLAAIVVALHYCVKSVLQLPFLDFAERFLADLMVTLPHSRKTESEADYIGLHLMTNACYDPRVAPAVMGRLGGNETKWLSTHPPPTQRVADLQDWLRTFVPLYDSKCASSKALSRKWFQMWRGS